MQCSPLTYNMVGFLQNIHLRLCPCQPARIFENGSWLAGSCAQIPQCTYPISHNISLLNRNVHIFVTKWCIVGYWTGALWALQEWSIKSHVKKILDDFSIWKWMLQSNPVCCKQWQTSWYRGPCSVRMESSSRHCGCKCHLVQSAIEMACATTPPFDARVDRLFHSLLAQH